LSDFVGGRFPALVDHGDRPQGLLAFKILLRMAWRT